MLQQILKLSKKDGKSSQPADIKRKKRRQSIDDNIHNATEEPYSKSKRMKIAQVKKHSGKGRSKKLTKTSEWPNLNEVTHHASPKIWDIFERFQNFTQRKVLKRHSSGLLESCDEGSAEKKPESNTQLDQDKDNVQRISDENHNQTSAPCTVDKDNESSVGGDRKRRCVEICDYEDELSCAGKREPQPVSAFKPKCLNFDHIDDL